jgi:hypothetical protein
LLTFAGSCANGEVAPEAFARRDNLARQPVLVDDPALPGDLRGSSLLTTAPEASTSAISTSNTPSAIGLPSASSWRRCGKTPKRPNSISPSGSALRRK